MSQELKHQSVVLTVVVTGLVITVAAFAASLLIPKPIEAEVTE